MPIRIRFLGGEVRSDTSGRFALICSRYSGAGRYRQPAGPVAITGSTGQYSQTLTQRAFGAALKASGIFGYQQGSLRNSYCSYGYESFGPAVTARNAGQSEQMLVRKYQKCVTSEQARQFWAIIPGTDGKAAY